jgi:hypothetical protein
VFYYWNCFIINKLRLLKLCWSLKIHFYPVYLLNYWFHRFATITIRFSMSVLVRNDVLFFIIRFKIFQLWCPLAAKLCVFMVFADNKICLSLSALLNQSIIFRGQRGQKSHRGQSSYFIFDFEFDSKVESPPCQTKEGLRRKCESSAYCFRQ